MPNSSILPIPERPCRRLLRRHWVCIVPLAFFLIWQPVADYLYSFQVWNPASQSLDSSLVHPVVSWMRDSELWLFSVSICAFLFHVFYLRGDGEGWTSALMKLLVLPPYTLLCLLGAWNPK